MKEIHHIKQEFPTVLPLASFNIHTNILKYVNIEIGEDNPSIIYNIYLFLRKKITL